MTIRKQPVSINFSQGLDTKTDPWQVQLGKFLALENSVFTKGGMLKKRNGYSQLTSGLDANYLTTFNGNLVGIGTALNVYSSASKSFLANPSPIHPVQLSTLPLIRNTNNQSACDSVIAANGLVCTVYTETVSGSPVYKYAVADSVTGQIIVQPTAITASGSSRVFLLGNYFIILISSTNLQYIAISTATPTNVTAQTNISSNYTGAATVAFDGVVVNNNLYIAWNGNDGAVHMRYLTSTLVQSNVVDFAGKVATMMSVCADITNLAQIIIYASFYNSGSSTGFTLAVHTDLTTALAPTSIIASGTVLNIISSAQNGVCTFFYEVSNAYSYDANIATNFIRKNTITLAGVVGTSAILVRSVGLASKSFILDSVIYFMSVYDGKDTSPVVPAFQPTYFLLNDSGSVIAKLAYANGGGYLTTGLPGVSVYGSTASIAYLFKDSIIPVNKNNTSTSGTVVSTTGVWSQLGVNLVNFNLTTDATASVEIGGNLNISGGFLWAYDGLLPVEQNFFLWPDSVEVTTATGGGGVTAQKYFYIATYEWSDNQGNVFRSAPSVPVAVTTTTATSTNTIHVPTLRLTYKTTNKVRIVLYRWSAGQQTYYQVSTLTNDTTVDAVTFTDAAADSSIIGNAILYTTGGVIENIGPPATNIMALFDTRLWLVDAEDPNLLWYSKQVIEATPVEMSDLFTFYIAPSTAAQGATGPITALCPLDDKLIIFKKDAIYYINGVGPDNTGSNNGYSQPIFITATVGCANPNSIVFMPQGLMFQSDKGIWLLGRDLSTNYIGAPVESYTTSAVALSALNIPATTQVRFTMSNKVTLMYDYYYSQWGTFGGIPAISSTLYQGLQTHLDSFSRVFQESEGSYLDGANPVLMSFKTSWINLAGLQGYQRAYFFFLLGQYYSPHKLNVQIGYNYNPSATQAALISPLNFTPNYGDDPLYGSTPFYGGGNFDLLGAASDLEKERVFFEQQRCVSFQITLNEIYDPTFGVTAGAGLTLSGLNLVVGIKAGWYTISPNLSTG